MPLDTDLLNMATGIFAGAALFLIPLILLAGLLAFRAFLPSSDNDVPWLTPASVRHINRLLLLLIVAAVIDGVVDPIARATLPAGVADAAVIPLAIPFAIVVILIMRRLSALLSSVCRALLRGYIEDDSQLEPVFAIVNAVLFALGGILILQRLGLDLSGILAAGGIGAVVVSFAAREMLANVFAFFYILLSRPFAFGDDIGVYPNRDSDPLRGQVKKIGLMSTTILRAGGTMEIPTRLFVSVSVEVVGQE